MSGVLAAALCRDGRGARLASVGIDVMRYKPGRKCVLRYDLDWAGGESLPWLVYAKAVRGADLGRASTLVAALRGSHAVGFDLPEPLGLLPDLSAELYAHVPGAALSTFCDAPDFPALCRGAGRALRQLQGVHVGAAPRRGIDARISQLDRTARELALLFPSARARIEDLRPALRERLVSMKEAPLSFVHGDFNGDNVLVHAGGLALVDLEDGAWDVPEKDVGSMWAQLLWLTLKGVRQPHSVEQGRRAFLAGYFEEPGRCRERAAAQAALHCFLYACQELRHRPVAPDARHAPALLAASQSILEGGLP
jgi:hypothetical protein